MQQQQHRRIGSSSSNALQDADDNATDTAAGPQFVSLVPSGSAQEQFLQLLQHDLAKVTE